MDVNKFLILALIILFLIMPFVIKPDFDKDGRPIFEIGEE